MNDAPIGIFDSGVGGLTVARAIIDQLPNESIIYVGDTANTPYGPKSIPEVRELALAVMDRLVDEGVKLLVIACNSASACLAKSIAFSNDAPVTIKAKGASSAVPKIPTGVVFTLAPTNTFSN